MKLTEADVKKVKAIGFLRNRGTDKFSGRVITENGVLTSKEIACVAEAAEKFGNGTVTFTSRLTVEVPGIDYENIEPFREFIAQKGLVSGGTGAKVRPIVACKGTTCVYGLHDTQALAKEIHDRFYVGYGNVALPHKFKIAVGGCPNNCVKPDLNDLGIIGQLVPVFDEDKCRKCGKCAPEERCPVDAFVRDENKKVCIDTDKCINCGICCRTCPFEAVGSGETMYKICVGGRWGKKVRMSDVLSRLYSRDEIFDIIEKAILLFKREGIKGERFGSTIERLGIDKVEEMLASDELLKDKEKILAE